MWIALWLLAGCSPDEELSQERYAHCVRTGLEYLLPPHAVEETTYDAAGRRSEALYFSPIDGELAITTNWSYDDQGRVTEQVIVDHARGDREEVVRWTWGDGDATRPTLIEYYDRDRLDYREEYEHLETTTHPDTEVPASRTYWYRSYHGEEVEPDTLLTFEEAWDLDGNLVREAYIVPAQRGAEASLYLLWLHDWARGLRWSSRAWHVYYHDGPIEDPPDLETSIREVFTTWDDAGFELTHELWDGSAWAWYTAYTWACPEGES